MARAALAPLLLCALLGACAAPEPPRASAAELVPLSPGAARLVSAAEAAWRLWGGIAVEGWPEALTEPPEATHDLVERIAAYWEATPGGRAVAERHRAFRDLHAAPPAELAALDPVSGLPWRVEPPSLTAAAYGYPPWSAAFVSHLAAEAGLGRRDFAPSASHALFLDHLIARALADPEGAAFRPRDPAEHPPRPGDLLCADRSSRPLPHWTARLAETGRHRPMHCDVVVSVGPDRVELIGGNLLDAVVRRGLPADPAGRVLAPPPDRAPFLLLMETTR